MFNGKRVLITGGSSGIGLATARELAHAGARLVISGRRKELLESAAASLRTSGGTVIPVQGDVADSSCRKTLLDVARAELGGLDILINNAGVLRAGRLDNVGEPDLCRMIEVNLTAPILLTRAALPLLRQSKDGLVVNVSSGFGMIGAPFYATYGATKAGLALFSEALRRELSDQGIHVLVIFPTATDTPMMETSRNTLVPRDSADEVARALVDAIQTRKFAVVRGGEARAEQIARNQSDPAALDEHFRQNLRTFEEAVRDHAAM